MSLHIAAKSGEIAETILLPGDPLRAKFIAETYLEDAKCFNEIRNVLGYTGIYKGKPVSVMGTGIGMPSMGLYSHELIADYGCKNLMRIGSAGSFQSHVKTKDLVMALSSSTDSNYSYTFGVPGLLAPCCDFTLAVKAKESADRLGVNMHTGNVLSVDVFYDDDPDTWKKWARMNVLAVEMESAALYYNGARLGARTLAIMTISDNFVTGERLTSEERETSFHDMMAVALETAISL